jgi:outer membrane protein TolC
MGLESPANIPVLMAPDIKIPVSIETWFDLAKNNYSSLKRSESLAESYRLSASASRRMRWPMLGLSASYGFRNGSTTDPMSGDVMVWGNMISFQANISLPIFSRHQQSKMALSMEAMRKSSESEATQIWRDTQAELRSLYSQSQRLTQSLNLYIERIISADEDAYRSAFASYAANRAPLSNLLNIAMNIYRDRQSANQVEYQLSQTLIDAGRYIINPNDWK